LAERLRERSDHATIAGEFSAAPGSESDGTKIDSAATDGANADRAKTDDGTRLMDQGGWDQG
jgi:hypothetical protein